jgi:hypothetical protein
MGAIDARALEGDLSGAPAQWRAIDPAKLSEAERTRRECLIDRFGGSPRAAAKSGDEFLDGLLELYRDYWTDSMLKRGKKEALEARLHAGLDGLRARYGKSPAAGTLDDAVDAIATLLEARNLHAITGVTLPYYELMAWRTNDERIHDITLPDDRVKVKVVLMDGFSSLGWGAWATCDRSFSGGWATKEAIFAVRQAYDLESETYRVSLLAHEGQHFADYVRFPKLEQPDLEYRAKLTEIVLSETSTHELLATFAANAGDSRDAPHAWANGQVIANLRAALGADPLTADLARVRGAARELLAASTKRHNSR